MTKIVIQVDEDSPDGERLQDTWSTDDANPHGGHIKSYRREDPERPGIQVIQVRIKKDSTEEALQTLMRLLGRA